MTNSPIHFYGQNNTYGEFSNFFDCPVYVYGITWRTSEHAFQAMKYTNLLPMTVTVHKNKPDHPEPIPFKVLTQLQFRKVMTTDTPGKAATFGRDRSVQIRDDWEKVKDAIMFEICLAKFFQNRVLQKVLISTGDRLLVEHTKNDSYWGDGGDGSGKNMLGQVLCMVRSMISGPA